MGSDDIFHRRKAKSQKDSARRKAKLKPYDHVLIVCEGEKTEPFYFEEMRIYLDLDSANIQIDGSCDSSPKSVVNHAHRLFIKEREKAGNYDRVFCVFDRDQHETFNFALKKIHAINAELKREGYSEDPEDDVFMAVRSVPAFEYWFLLHFYPSTKPYTPTERKSVGDQVIDDLKVYFPGYQKKHKGFYKYSLDTKLIDGAKAHSKRIFDHSIRTGEINPSTNVHKLVEYLEKIKHN